MPFEGKEDRSRGRSAFGFGVLCVALTVAGARGVVRAQDVTDSEPPTTRLEPVVVVAEPPDPLQSSEDAAGFSDLVYTEEAWRGFRTLSELLEHATGVQVTRFGGREDFATISVRGSGAGQVKILIDGVSLSRAQNRVVNLADLPLDSVQRIEVYRGFTPARFPGSDAASLVNIITKRDAGSGYRLSAGYGSFDTTKFALQASLPSPFGDLSGYLTHRRSDGDFRFVDDGGTPQNPFDDTRKRRTNNGYESLDMLVKLRAALARGGTLTLSENAFYKDEGVPGLGGATSDRASLRSVRNIWNAAWERADGNLGASWDLTYLSETFRDPLCPLPSPPGCSTLGFGFERSRNRTWASAWNLHYAREFGAMHRLQSALQLGLERFDGEVSGATGTQRRQQRATLSISAGDEIRFAGGRIVVLPQLRQQTVWNDFDGSGIPFLDPGARLPSSRAVSLDPRLGLRWEATRAITLKANAGTYFRPPDFSEEFGDTGFSKANPELKPEQGVSADAGFQLHLGRVSFEYAYFLNRSDDLIVFVQTGQRVSKALNVDRARVRGHELRLEGNPWEHVTVSANFTRQRTENRTPQPGVNGNELPALPSNEAYLSLAWRGTDRFGGRWQGSYELAFRGRRFFDEANLLRVPSQTVHDLSVSWSPPRSDVQIGLGIENLSGDQVADQQGFPVPGRSVSLTVSIAGGSHAGR